jgi:ubiquinol-cytochrome c reductase iron-sulfur subunit
LSSEEVSQESSAADAGTDEQNALKPEVNTRRRYFLIGATSAVAGVGVVGAAIPFVSYWNPSAKARAMGAPVTIDFSKLLPGEMMSPIMAWRGKPIFIVYRDEATIASLAEQPHDLADPDSANPEQQPDYAKNDTRSTRPEIGIYVGICTHLGCSPKFVKTDNFAATNQGGFFCPCHGSRFDLAGRVARNNPAPDNLTVPPHRFESDTVVVIGEEGGAA